MTEYNGIYGSLVNRWFIVIQKTTSNFTTSHLEHFTSMSIMANICAKNNLHFRFMLRMSVSQFDHSLLKLTVMISIEYRYDTHARVPRDSCYETSRNVLFNHLRKIGRLFFCLYTMNRFGIMVTKHSFHCEIISTNSMDITLKIVLRHW